jgi:Tol biopolymer transport system component
VKKQAATPHWSPDGRTLVFDSNESGTGQLYTISPDGGKMTRLASDRFDDFNATWSRDERWMYFTSTRTGREEIWKMPAGGGSPFQVTHDGGVKGIESEDGKTLYFGNDRSSGSVRKMPVAGGPEQQLTDSLYRDNFAVTKKGIYYMTNPGNLGTSTLRFYSFATGATTIILQMGIPEYGLDVSPDGRYLVYAQLDDPASNLMLVENFH